MKRTYFKGCECCNSTGYVQHWYNENKVFSGNTSALTDICPVCDGSGKILVTEEDYPYDNYIVPKTTI